MTHRRSYPLPTDKQQRLIAAYLLTGSIRAAAEEIGLSVFAANNVMREARERTGLTTVAMVACGIRDGWLSVA